MSTNCLIIAVELLFVAVIFLVSSNDHLVIASSSLQNDQVLLQPLHKKDSKLQHSPHLELLRKLRLFEEQTAKRYVGDHQASQSYNKQKEDASGNAMQDSSRTGTMQREYVKDGADTSQLFTMDYSDVRRRRPIHNMSVKPSP